MSRTHQLKTWPTPFQAILDGTKRHEIRVDDREFAVGDVLELHEFDPTVQTFGYTQRGPTGRSLSVRVTYLTPGGQWGLPAGLCVMSIERVPEPHADEEFRCAVCGWPLAATVELGCVRGNCSMRPRPERLYAPERAEAEVSP